MAIRADAVVADEVNLWDPNQRRAGVPAPAECLRHLESCAARRRLA